MKLLIVIPTLDRSGAEKQFCLLAQGLAARGVDVHVVALTRGGPFESDLKEAGVRLTILEKRRRLDWRTLRQLRSIILDEGPDVVLSCLFSGNSYTRLVAKRLGTRRPKIAISERCVDSWKSGWQLWLDKRLQSCTDVLIGNSESVREFYKSQGFPADRIRVIHNGVTTPDQPEISKAELCHQLEIPEEARLIMFVGRLAPQKRIQDLLWAMQMLRHSHPDAYLLIIGDGPQREELQLYAHDVEAASHTRFLGHRDEAASLLHYADVFWLASEFEGMSNSLMEAMVCGVPAVVSDIPPNRELVEHGVDGWIANLGDTAGFTQFTARLLDDHEQSKKMGTAGQQKMSTQFSVETMIDQYDTLLSELGQ